MSTLLSPRAINRCRDLLAIGPLTIDVETDEELVRAGLVQVYSPSKIDEHEREDHLAQYQRLAKRVTATAAMEQAFGGNQPTYDAWKLMQAAPHARKRFYNAQGGVRACWWAGSGKSFAEYMQKETSGSVPPCPVG